MKWREVISLTMGMDIQYLPAAVSSVLFCLVAMAICLLMHTISSLLLPRNVRLFALDFFKSLAFCTYPLGFGFTRAHHGHTGYFLIMVPISVVNLMMMREGSVNPVDHLVNLVKGREPIWKAILRIALQVTGGISAFYLAREIMKFEFHEDYKKIVAASCESDLKISLVIGCGIEMLGTFIETLAYSSRFSKYTHIDLTLKCLVTATLVSLAVHLTGMYMQPALATGYTFGCRGTGYHEHLFVYWTGPFIGALLANEILDKFRGSSKKLDGDGERKKKEDLQTKKNKKRLHYD